MDPTTKGIMNKLMEAFQSADDNEVDLIDQMKRLTQQIKASLAAQTDDVKAAITGLATGSGAVAPPASTASTAAHLRALTELKNGTSERVADLRSRKTKAETSILALRRDLADVAETAASLEKDKVDQIPTVKHSISLYVNISNIRWDLDAANVSGVILPAGGAPMKAFDIDPTASSEFDVTNQLWDLIAEAS